MNPYLTKKATPSWIVVWAENLVCLVDVMLAVFLCITAALGIRQDGIVWGPLLIIGMLVALLVALLCWLTDRKRARVHARVITGILSAAEKGSMPFDELMKATRINRLEQVINKLNSKGYIRNVAVVRGEVYLTDRERKQAVCAYCGASLMVRAERIDKCPSCGSNVIKY